jgi:thioredoxin-dependent peroxiredoxin
MPNAPVHAPLHGLAAGDKAPDFVLDGFAGAKPGKVSLRSFAGKYVVVYFYPKDKTPGCTREGQAFSQAHPAFKKAGAVVLGISKDSPTTHASFAESCDITVPLLSDPDLAVHKAYGAYGEKTNYGKTTMGTLRSTFIVGPDGKIVRAFAKVKVDGHADAVLKAIAEHTKGEGSDTKRGKGAR